LFVSAATQTTVAFCSFSYGGVEAISDHGTNVRIDRFDGSDGSGHSS
jgi:hypothetical protein